MGVLEQLILDSDVESINEAFRLSGVSPSSRIDEGMMLWVHKMWTAGNAVEFDASAEYAHKMAENDTKVFKEQILTRKVETLDTRFDVVFNYEYAHRHTTNPFISHAYSSSASLDIAHEWSNNDIHRCHELRAHLSELDPRG